MPAVAAPVIDWAGGTGAQNAAEPIAQLAAAVIITPSQFNPVSTAADDFCPVGGGGGDTTYSFPIGG